MGQHLCKRLSNSPCVSQEESLRVRSIFLPMRAQCRAFAPSLLTTDLLAMSVIYLPLKRGTVTGFSMLAGATRVAVVGPGVRMRSSKWIRHNGVAPAFVSLDCRPTSPCCQNHPLTGYRRSKNLVADFTAEYFRLRHTTVFPDLPA